MKKRFREDNEIRDRKIGNEVENVINPPKNEQLLQESADSLFPSAKKGTQNNIVSLESLVKEKLEKEEAEARPCFISRKDRSIALQPTNLPMPQQPLTRSSSSLRTTSTISQSQTKMTKQELEDLQNSYLNKVEQAKNKPRRTFAERSKLAFEWKDSDDTSRDVNPLYDKKLEVKLLFGTGKRAGSVEESSPSTHLSTDQPNRYLNSLSDEPMAKKKKKKFGELDEEKSWIEKSLAEMTSRDWRIFCEDHEIITKGGNIPHPFRAWEESGLPQEILDAIDRAGIDYPTPIQMQCIPVGLQNRDLIGLSETGSGKTLAYLAPLLVYVSKQPRLNSTNCHNGPHALILCPSRELALQIEDETKRFGEFLNIKTFTVIGGIKQEEQTFLLSQGAEIIIATPGRLVDCLKNQYVVLNQCNYVVLDEADKMVTDVFEEQLQYILDCMPTSNLRPDEEKDDVNDDLNNHLQMSNGNEKQIPDKKIYRQTTMFSATMPTAIERLAAKYMRKKVVVTIGEVGRGVKLIKQRIEMLEEDQKRKRLLEILRSSDENAVEDPMIIFVNQRDTADSLKRLVADCGYKPIVLHGGKQQNMRENAILGFKRGKYDVLLATDVAARGIDIPGIRTVINYDMPKNIQTYTNRIGRTGRAGKSGVAIGFLKREDTDIMYDLKQQLLQVEAQVPLELAAHEASQRNTAKISQ